MLRFNIHYEPYVLREKIQKAINKASLKQISKTLNERINLGLRRRGIRIKKRSVHMKGYMTSPVLSWGYFNVWGPVNQQSRLSNGCTASTNELACFPSLPHIKNFSLQSSPCSLIGWSRCDHYVLLLPICFTSLLWEDIQLFVTIVGQREKEPKQHHLQRHKR